MLGHEISHVANGDMVTLTLIQGVVNTFVIFLSRVVGNIGRPRGLQQRARPRPGVLDHDDRRRRSSSASSPRCIVMWFSRQREFRADAGGARLAGRENMITALERLKRANRAAAGQDGGLRHLGRPHRRASSACS